MTTPNSGVIRPSGRVSGEMKKIQELCHVGPKIVLALPKSEVNILESVGKAIGVGFATIHFSSLSQNVPLMKNRSPPDKFMSERNTCKPCEVNTMDSIPL